MFDIFFDILFIEFSNILFGKYSGISPRHHRLWVQAWPTAFGTGRFGPMAAQPRAAHSHGAIGGGGVAPLLKSRNRHLAGEEKSFGSVRHH